MRPYSQSVTYRPIGLVIALALLGVVAISSYISWNRYLKFADLTRESNRAIAILYQTVISIREAESNERGYLIAQDKQYLARYFESVASVEAQLKLLQSLAADAEDKNVTGAFIHAVRNRMSELAETMAAIQEGQRGSALILAKGNPGLHSMARITDLQNALAANLQSALVRNRRSSRYYARISQYVSILGSAGIFLLVLLANMRIRKMMAASARLNAELSMANEDLRQFVYSASHDLQEPVRTIGIFADLAVRRTEHGQPSRVELQYVKRAAAQMSNIIHDLLIYTQTLNAQLDGGAGSDMGAIADRVLQMLASGIQQTGAVISCGPLGRFPMSETHAQIVLQNLVSNAIKYRKPDRTPEIRIAMEAANSIAKLSVADNGIGIAPKYHGQIFGLFKRLHSQETYPGTGLGLAICKKIVERYGGQIRVQSELDKGATFLVEIPVN